MLIRFVIQPGAQWQTAEMEECPRLEEFVDLGDGMNYWVRSVRWWSVWNEGPEVHKEDPEFQRQADVELAMGHPPRLSK